MFLSQKAADDIGLLFAHTYYDSIISNFDSISELYASNTTVVFNGSKLSKEHAITNYREANLSKSFFEFKTGGVSSSPIYAGGVSIKVKGLLRQEKEGKEVSKELTQDFILMPTRDTSFVIVRDCLVLGEAKVVKPKKGEEKWKPKARSHKFKAGQKEGSKASEFSYARAAATSSATSKGQVMDDGNGARVWDNKHKIRIKKCTAAITKEILHNEFAQFGTIVDVKKINSSTAIIIFEDVNSVESIMAKPAKDRVLKLSLQGEEFVLEIWAQRPFPKIQPKQK